MAYLARISIYPIKSLDPLIVHEGVLLPSGALARDREFGIFDMDGKTVNGKRTDKIHGIHAAYDLQRSQVCLHHASAPPKRFSLLDDRKLLDEWMTSYFGYPVTLKRNEDGGFPDDKNAHGPTIISTATLEEVASWFSGVTPDSMRVRFRANLEIGGVPPFWEDRLYREADTETEFQIGNVTLRGTNPCQRCVVPPRDPETGEAIPDFSQIFRAKREQTLPAWADRSRFNHFYRLAVNTRVGHAEAGKVLRIADPVVL